MTNVHIIPRFRGGSFEYIAELLCKFLMKNNITCKVSYIDKNNLTELTKSINIHNIIFVGNFNDSSLLRAIPYSLLSRNRIFYATTEGPYFGYLKRLASIFRIIVPSDYVKKELEFSGIKVEAVIPHGIDVLEFAKFGNTINYYKNRNSKISLLTVISEPLPRKGLKYLLEAVKCIRTKRQYELIIKTSTEINIPEELRSKVRVIGRFLSRQDLLKLYLHADIVIVPSLAEGFGLPIIEAFAACKPVVSLNAPPMNELNSEKTGWLINASKELVIKSWPTSFRFHIPDINDFCEKLEDAIEDDEARWKKSLEACRIRQLYHYEKVYKAFLNFLL